MYTPCSVAGRVSGTVEEQLHVASTTTAAAGGSAADGNGANAAAAVVVVVVGGGDGGGGGVVVIVVVVIVIVVVSVDVTVLHVHMLYAVYPELGWHALLVVVDGVADWHSVLVG